MAAGNIADGISHGHDYQTESQSSQQIAGTGSSVAAHHGSSAAGEQHQHESANEFSHILFDSSHCNDPPFVF